MRLLNRLGEFQIESVPSLCTAGLSQGSMKNRNVTAAEASQLIGMNNTLVILDVRTEEEFNRELGHLPKAILIPIQELKVELEELNPYKTSDISVYHGSGRSSALVCELLSAMGFNVHSLRGRILSWRKVQEELEHYPVEPTLEGNVQPPSNREIQREGSRPRNIFHWVEGSSDRVD